MSDIVQNTSNVVVDLADSTLDSTIKVVGSAADAAQAAVQAPINVGGKTIDACLEELRVLKDSFMRVAHDLVDAVTQHLP